MSNTVILFALLCILTSALPIELEKKSVQNYGDYTIETGFCGQRAGINIYKKQQPIYSLCFGDGYYSHIDTYTLNNDGIPDFIYVFSFEDYSFLGTLVSSPDTPYYKNIDLDYEIMDCIAEKSRNYDIHEIHDMAFVDTDGDGDKEILTYIGLGENYKFIAIPGCTDTIKREQIANEIKKRLQE